MIFYILQVVIFSMVLTGCGKTKETSSVSELDGAWSNTCTIGTDPFGIPNSVSSLIFYEISSTSWINTARTFADATCADEALVIEQRMEVQIGGLASEPASAKEVDITVSSVTVTVKADQYVTLYNQLNAFCGGGFVKNVPKTLTEASCANDELIRKWFEKKFTIYKVEGSKLYFGKRDSSGQDSDCSTNAKRCKKFDTTVFSRS